MAKGNEGKKSTGGVNGNTVKNVVGTAMGATKPKGGTGAK